MQNLLFSLLFTLISGWQIFFSKAALAAVAILRKLRSKPSHQVCSLGSCFTCQAGQAGLAEKAEKNHRSTLVFSALYDQEKQSTSARVRMLDRRFQLHKFVRDGTNSVIACPVLFIQQQQAAILTKSSTIHFFTSNLFGKLLQFLSN